MSPRPSAAAHISAVSRVAVVAAFTAAPLDTRARTISILPVRAAVISGVRPFTWAAFGFAPAPSNRSTIAALAFSQARASGVTP